MAGEKDAHFISTLVLLKDVPPVSKETSQEAEKREVIRYGHSLEVPRIEDVRHTYENSDDHQSGAVCKLNKDYCPDSSQASVSTLYRMTPASISIEIHPELIIVLSELKQEYGHILSFVKHGDPSQIKIIGPIESIANFLDLLGEQGGRVLLGQSCASPTDKQLNLSPPPKVALAEIHHGQSVYENMSPDALALLEKLPIGLIEGVHYDAIAGRVLIDKETPQLEEERITKFQSAYQSIIGKKLKIVEVPIPSGASPDAVASVVQQYNTTYDQCVFTQLEGAVKAISVSSRQFEQAKTLLSDEIIKTTSSSRHGAKKCEVIHLSSDRKLTLKKANLVKEEVDIIVNPANERLAHGGGIAAALNEASHGQLQKYSRAHIQRKGQVPAGNIAITSGGGDLKCSKVIHAVGPEKPRHSDVDCERLINCVVCEALKAAERHNANSIAFPAISTGLFGVKKELVARCVIDTITAYYFTKPSPVLSDIRIVIIDDKTYTPFARYFKQKQTPSATVKGDHRTLIQPAKLTLKPQQSIEKKPSSPPTSPSLDTDTSDNEDTGTSNSQTVQTSVKILVIPDKKLSSVDINKIQHLLSSLADNWDVLGFSLGFSKDELDQISATPAHNPRVYLFRMLSKWLAGDVCPPTVSALVKALQGIQGTGAVIQRIVSEYKVSSDSMSSAEKKDELNISYPHHLPEGNPITTAYGATLTTEQSTNQTSQIKSGSTIQTSAAGKNHYEQQQELMGFTSAQSTLSDFDPLTATGTTVTSPSSVVSYHSPPATVSTAPPPGLSHTAQSNAPYNSTLSGYNDGQMWKYPVKDGHMQYPAYAAGSQSSNANFPQHMYPQSVNPHTPNMTQGGPMQPGGSSYVGGSGQSYYGTQSPGATGGYPQQSGVWTNFGGSGGGKTSVSFSTAVVGGAGQSSSVQLYSQGHSQAASTEISAKRTHEGSKPADEKCPICLSEFTDPIKTKCGHYFCKGCFNRALQASPFCATCKTPLRTIVGNQPEGGSMTVQRYVNSRLPGYKNCGTIEIHYRIPSGIQSKEHPNPGKRYSGASRTAYLPDNKEGREVLELLRRAFEARLIFTVGTSVTSGQTDVVTWNDIHHKTRTDGGPQHYGYPDPTYLERVKADLAAKGIMPASHESTI